MEIVRTDEEINKVRNQANKGMDTETKYPGMKYEDGVDCVLRWLFGETDDLPFEED